MTQKMLFNSNIIKGLKMSSGCKISFEKNWSDVKHSCLFDTSTH